ncbi:MAG: general secretion pathway protein GspK [Planctomycetes bacterium]|nr:general secretion pathway protein GspK [Planctomycetota bacterium]
MNKAVHPAVQSRQGSALLLVVVVTMLLSVIGIVFIMTARLRGIAASGVTDSRDLNAAVQSVVSRVDTVLVQDLFGKSLNKSIIDGTDPNNEPYDSPAADTWLASLEPDATTFKWPYITDLSGGTVTLTWDRVSAIVAAYQDKGVVAEGKAADADGDGVADSMWMKLPNLTTSGGKPVYAAVRIIDNCAMLNLNTAFGFYQDMSTPGSWYTKPWYIWYNAAAPATNTPYSKNTNYCKDIGRYLSEVNYGPFLRGSDINRVERIQLARDVTARDNGIYSADIQNYPRDYHNLFIMNQDSNFTPFNIADELEIRNRYLLTSYAISRFEKSDEDETNDAALYPPYFTGLNPSGRSYVGIGYQTFDWGRGEFIGGWNVPLRSKRIPCITDTGTDNDLAMWRIRLNPANFDQWDDKGVLKTTTTYNYYYDRRHLCTFYSFDRNIRRAKTAFYTWLDSQSGVIRDVFVPKNRMAVTTNFAVISGTSYNYNNIESRRRILHLLYAFREYYLPSDYSTLSAAQQQIEMRKAAIKSAQIMANMIDYTDDDTAAATGPFANSTYGSQVNANPTYITRVIVRQMILEASGNTIDIGATAPGTLSPYEFGLGLNDTTTPPFETVYGYERQPFISEVYTRYVAASGGAVAFALELINPYPTALNLQGWKIQIGTQNCPLDSSYASIPSGRLVIYNTGMAPPTSGTVKPYPSFGLGTPMQLPGNVLRLQRPDPANAVQFLTVDRITDGATDGITNGQREHLVTDGIRVTKRQDPNWGFTNLRAYVNDTEQTLGIDNNVTVAGGYALPVANNGLPIGRLADLESVAFIGNQNSGTDPNTITKLVSEVSNEAGVRFDITTASNLLGYICTLNRDEGNLPGRININTAPKYVIAAAIPPNLVMSSTTDPNVLYIAGQIVANRPYTNLADLLKIPAIKRYANTSAPDVGENTRGDFEERDWILSRLSNIFTVRSDTFTAYILVRLGTDGPQRRMLAIFDRSNVWSPTDKPKLVALHPVPDPR